MKFILGLILAAGGCSVTPVDKAYDAIYYGGIIIPMTSEEETYEALAVREGIIAATGSLNDLIKKQGKKTKMIDLKGRTLLPGFIDAHSHIMMGMQLIDQVNLSSPPVSDVTNISGVINKLEEKKKENSIPAGEWIIGWGYDPDLLDEGRHPTKADLDLAFPDHPVFLLHVSGHLAVVNSRALSLAGISAESPDPAGGQIMRDKGGREPNGIIAELAVLMMRAFLPQADSATTMQQLDEVMALYASNGITTANDGFTTEDFARTLKSKSKSDKLPIDVIALISFKDMELYLKDKTIRWGEYHNGLKYAGIKVTTDGSPQGKTALMNEPYLTEVPGCQGYCRGISVVTSEQLDHIVKAVYSAGVQLYVHCNGDAAIDMLLGAHSEAVRELGLDSKQLRTVVIHSQFMRPDLVEAYKMYGIIPSYFTNHTFYWGDVHMRNMGPERTKFISPLYSSTEAGIMYTNHSDYPITPLDPMFIAWSAVERTSRSGVTIGSEERVTIYEAIKAMTINAAYQYKEEDKKGTLEPGKMADMVILSQNPLQINPTNLTNIEVLETIKEGHTIFTKYGD